MDSRDRNDARRGPRRGRLQAQGHGRGLRAVLRRGADVGRLRTDQRCVADRGDERHPAGDQRLGVWHYLLNPKRKKVIERVEKAAERIERQVEIEEAV
ncbi:MAG TPA: hypothetical protein VLM18_02815 [Croceibacterium sp.]|nr:hypothetical protein [Croceibacterium sp.]